MRKKEDALCGQLLGYAREIVAEQGPGALSIREIAGRAGIAVGTVYNYFVNKNDILLALTEEYWQDAMEEMDKRVDGGSFADQLGEIYLFLRERVSQSAGTLMNSLQAVEDAGRYRMEAMLLLLRQSLTGRMERDTGIRQDIWNGSFTQDRYAGFLVNNLMALLRSRDADIDLLSEIVRRTLY